jgi:hypothetical protein
MIDFDASATTISINGSKRTVGGGFVDEPARGAQLPFRPLTLQHFSGTLIDLLQPLAIRARPFLIETVAYFLLQIILI